MTDSDALEWINAPRASADMAVPGQSRALNGTQSYCSARHRE